MPRFLYGPQIPAEPPYRVDKYVSEYRMFQHHKHRGLLIPEWRNFHTFLKAVGQRPPGYILYRPDRSKPVGPDNWAWYKKLEKGASPDTRAEYTLDSTLRTRYNMTFEEYCALGEAQNWVCAICKKPSEEKYWKTGQLKRLCVDHCHKTGKNRGLLCNQCNQALGKMQDSKELLQAAIDYLNKYDYTVDT